MEAWVRGVIIWFVVCFLTTYFDGSLGTEVWGWEHGNGKLLYIVWFKWFFFILAWKHGHGKCLFVLLSVFGLHILVGDKKPFYIVWFKWFISYWHESMSMARDYLFCCPFLDHIFLLGLESWDGSVGLGAWGWEQFFSEDLLQKTFFHCMIEIIFFTFTWKHGWGEWLFDS